MGVCLLPGRDEAPPPGCSRRAAAREEALTRPPSGAIGWFDYSAPPPARRHVGLLVLHHFPDATYTSVAAQRESLHR